MTERDTFTDAMHDYYTRSKIKAARDIEEGEELCITYIPLTKPREYRQKALREKYSFICDCKCCCPSTLDKTEAEVVEASDARRKQLDEMSDIKMTELPPDRLVEFYNLGVSLLADEDLNDPLLASQFWQGGFIGRMKTGQKKPLARKASKKAMVLPDEPIEWLRKALLYADVCWGPHVRATQELRDYLSKMESA